MELIEISRQHYISLENVQNELNISEHVLDMQLEQYEYAKKPLGIISYDKKRMMPCKSACAFLYWYMESSFCQTQSLNSFCLSLKKYTKKIPKRVLSRSMRIEIAYRQHYKCNHCGLFPIPPNFEVDHIIELQDGGQDVAENLQCLCVPCHSEKTRLNRLRKSKLFKASTEHKYAIFMASNSTVADTKQSSCEAGDTGQVFSKYFRKNAL